MPHTTEPGIIILTGTDLAALIDAFHTTPTPHLVLLWVDEGGVKLKFNNGRWSPPLGHLDA